MAAVVSYLEDFQRVSLLLMKDLDEVAIVRAVSLRAGMDIVTLQQQMGHRCISSTVHDLTPDLRRPPAQPIDLFARLRPYQRRALDDIAAWATSACGMHSK